LQEARQRFLDQFAHHSDVLKALLDLPLKTWLSLSDAAKEVGRNGGWVEIEPSPHWSQIDPAIVAGDAIYAEDHRVHLELIPLRESLRGWAADFSLVLRDSSLVLRDSPVLWAMNTAVETLHQAGSRPPEKRRFEWAHMPEMSQAYSRYQCMRVLDHSGVGRPLTHTMSSWL
jgi:hypothetical protein